VRNLTGAAARRELALAQEFTPDTWQKAFRSVTGESEQVVNGKKCYRVMLVRSDSSQVERFFDEFSGLLVREISSEFDAAGVEHGFTLNVNGYGIWDAIRYPSSVHITSSSGNRSIKTESVRCTSYAPQDAFVIPHEVIRALSDLQNWVAMLSRARGIQTR